MSAWSGQAHFQALGSPNETGDFPGRSEFALQRKILRIRCHPARQLSQLCCSESAIQQSTPWAVAGRMPRDQIQCSQHKNGGLGLGDHRYRDFHFCNADRHVRPLPGRRVSGNHLSHSSLAPAKSSSSATISVALTAFSKLLPAATGIAEMFRRHCAT